MDAKVIICLKRKWYMRHGRDAYGQSLEIYSRNEMFYVNTMVMRISTLGVSMLVTQQLYEIHSEIFVA